MKYLNIVVLTLLPFSAFAEVADKMQSYESMWLTGLILAVVFAGLTYFRTGFVLLALLTSVFLCYGYSDMVYDNTFKHLVVKEMGEGYFIQGYVSSSLAVVFSLFALYLRKRRNLK